ncbi:hypothetical protein ASF43_17450 [Pseudorhodoferax sp. Leaf267]|nr:hypothetical protein ASF43_17450 [Pseudorhodoferax sp. Leaf267]
MAGAQTSGNYEPQRGQAGKDVIWIPSPDEVVNRMLQMAEVKASDRVFDLGSGDGKIAIAAGRNYGARSTGLEFNPDMVQLSNRLAKEAGVADKVNFRQADIFVADFSSATVVTMYLLPELNLRLRPKLFTMPPGTRVVSHSFTMGDWQPDETARAGTGEVFLWRIPANASGQWKLTAPGVAEAGLRFSQKYQMLEGDAEFGPLRASIVQPRLSGDVLRFQVRDPSGVVLSFDGKVAGNRITGTVSRPGQAATPFQATREGEPSPIAERAPDPAELSSASLAASLAR